jgi:hypothetical protein
VAVDGSPLARQVKALHWRSDVATIVYADAAGTRVIGASVDVAQQVANEAGLIVIGSTRDGSILWASQQDSLGF